MNRKNYIALFLIMSSIVHASDGAKTEKKTKKDQLSKKYMKLSKDEKLRLLAFDFAAVYTLLSQMNTNLVILNENLTQLNSAVLSINDVARKAYETMSSVSLGIQSLMNNSTTEESSDTTSNNRDRSNTIDVGSIKFAKSGNNKSQETFDSKKMLNLKKIESQQIKKTHVPSRKSFRPKDTSKDIKIEIVDTEVLVKKKKNV